MHQEAADYAMQWLSSPEIFDVLEIGARDINGSIRRIWKQTTIRPHRWVGVDLMSGDDVVDEVIDACSPAFPNFITEKYGHFQIVVCMETLEHCESPAALISNAAACLEPLGAFIMTTAGPKRAAHSMYDGEMWLRPSEFYENLTIEGTEEMFHLAGLQIVDLVYGRDQQDLWAVARRPA